jgi:hypothetical protein
MAHLDPSTGLWQDDAAGPAPPNQPGALGMQQDTPQTPPMLGPPAPPPPMEGPPVPPGVGQGSPPMTQPVIDGHATNNAAPPIPPVEPYKPVTPVPVPPSRVVTPAESATLGQIDQNTAAQGVTAQQEGQVGAAKAGVTSVAADRDAAAALVHQQAVQKITDDAAKRTQELQAKAQQQYDAYRQMGVKDPQADQSFGHRLLAAIAIGLGEYSSKMNGGSNRAAELINAANAQNIALQKAAIEKQYHAFELAGGDVLAAQKQRDDALKSLDLKDAALTDASKTKLASELKKMGATDEQIAANVNVQKLDATALDKREAVNRQISTEDAKISAAEIAAANRKKAHAASAGGGGTGMNNAAEQLAAMIAAGKDGKPLPQQDIIHAANQLGIPLEAKAGHVSLKTVLAGSVFNAEQGRKDAKVGLGEERMVSKEAKDWAKTNGVDVIAKQQRELSGLQKEIADNPHNPLLQALAVEKAVSAARGGAASKQALALALGHLGGSLDSAEGVISKIRSGEIGPKQMENFNGFIRGQLGTAQQEGKNAFDAFNKYAESAPPEQQAALKASRGRLFSGLSGFGGKAEGGGGAQPSRADRAKAIVNDSSKRSLYSDAQWAALIQASRGP